MLLPLTHSPVPPALAAHHLYPVSPTSPAPKTSTLSSTHSIPSSRSTTLGLWLAGLGARFARPLAPSLLSAPHMTLMVSTSTSSTTSLETPAPVPRPPADTIKSKTPRRCSVYSSLSGLVMLHHGSSPAQHSPALLRQLVTQI